MFFIEKTLSLLKTKGSVSLIIDANFHENAYKNIRKYILTNSSLHYFVDKFTAFENVNSDQVILSTIRASPQLDHEFRYFADFENAKSNNVRMALQNDFYKNQDFEFVLDKKIIESDNVVKLCDLYDTVTGIQIGIGGDRQYKGTDIRDLFYSDVQVNNKWFPIISLLSKDFFKYCNVRYSGFLNCDEDLGSEINKFVPKCNIAIPKYRYYISEPKVVVRQSSDSIVASYVENPCVAEYSAFSIRQKHSEYSLKYLIAILNSKFITFYSRENNIIKTGHKKQPQIRIKGLDVIPIKKISFEEQKPLIKLVDRILAAKKQEAGADVSELEREIDRLVYALYDLTPDEIALIEAAR